MLSHLRFHRRGSSNPTSPIPEQQPPRDFSPLSQTQQHDATLGTDPRPASSHSSSLPPTLPPITRVTSADASLDFPDFSAHSPPTLDPPRPSPIRSPYGQNSSFIGGVALQNYRRGEPPAISTDSQPATSPLPPAQTRPDNTLQPPPFSSGPSNAVTSPQLSPNLPNLSPSFITPTDLRNSAASPTGRTSSASTRQGEQQAYPPTMMPAEPPKGKKGLPFLKNPMSTLLMRRKANQNVPDLLPLPLQTSTETTYDPRIRGTRFHDFSAPRPRRPVHPSSASTANTSALPNQPDSGPPPIPDKSRLRRQPTETVDVASGKVCVEPHNQTGSGTGSMHLSSTTIPGSHESRQDISRAPSGQSTQVASALRDKPLPPQASPPVVPPKDDVITVTSRSISSKNSARTNRSSLSKLNRNASTNRSRRFPASEGFSSEVLSSIPKHMKSTSSRFSFDMIGAAKQEKLLEERHRQRELERQTTQVPSISDSQRDSRFDDMDDFDYDAMMDDDGLEEAIPGVNADYEEEYIPGLEDDYGEEPIPGINVDIAFDEPVPASDHDDYDIDDVDNDQENFSGFVFQRSNPQSSLASPHSAGMLITPRDAEGRVIGFALSKDTPGLPPEMPSPLPAIPLSADERPLISSEDLTGLGIQGPGLLENTGVARGEQPHRQNEFEKQPANIQDRPKDDLYFDDGLSGFDAEFADELDFGPGGNDLPFDEALFDLDDTDQYGRPIPGAFQKAKEAHDAACSQARRESDDGTSGPVDTSIMSQSTTRTSISAPGPQHFVSKAASEEISPQHNLTTFTHAVHPTGQDSMAAYQAALAAAAHQAAAAGKFRRESPPTSPSFSAGGDKPSPPNEFDDAYDEPSRFDFDDYERDDLDDFDLDDDDIIAEANASALANDSDGWYGREFGFYSAPGSHQTNNSVAFEYANGGYFGPSGIGHGMNGRMASREPNLTPITERSEYSNRNSIMSLAVPPIGSGASTSIQSPGLAQLAMMADSADDSNMTLSALLRLRTKAWGGSQASLVSSRDGSPRSERGDGANSPLVGSMGHLGVGGFHARKNSSFSVLSRESETYSSPGSPTLTMSLPAVLSSPPVAPPAPGQNVGAAPIPGRALSPTPSAPIFSSRSPEPPIQATTTSVAEDRDSVSSRAWPNKSTGEERPDAYPTMQQSNRRSGISGHRHKGSAGSISYIREEESGETRWIMERRRLDENGEVEILEREVLTGGRI